MTGVKKSDSLLRAAFSVTLLVVVSKLMGFGREALIAAYFGTTAETDAFFFAQGMPSMLFPAVGNSLAFAFTSLYVHYSTRQGEESGDLLASRLLLFCGGLGMGLSVLGIFLAPVLVPLLAPGFTPEQFALATQLTRLSMGAFVLTILQCILGAIMNAKRFFIAAQVAGFVYNGYIIAITAALGTGQDVYVLMMTVVAGMLLQVATMVLLSHRHFRFALREPVRILPEARQLLRLAAPILLGNSVVQINNIVDKAISSTLPDGSLSALSYASTLNSLVIDIFVISLSTVLFPELTRDAASGDQDRFGHTLMRSLSGLTMLLIPISVISGVDAEEIVSVIFGRGSFDATSISLTGLVLMCYSPRFVFAGIREVLARAFFAMQDTKTPMVISTVGVGCNIVCSLLLAPVLGLMGVALGTVVSVFVIAVLLLRQARHRIEALPVGVFLHNLLRQLLAGAGMLLCLLLLRQFVSIPWPLLRLVVDGAVSVIVYLLLILFLCRKQLKQLLPQGIPLLGKNKGDHI